MMKETPRDLPSLTSLRALAALMVFGYHLAPGVVPFNIDLFGYAGVAFFFVLSGFVLTWGAWPLARPSAGTQAGASTRSFYVRRFARIYPSHAVVWLIVLLLPLTELRPTLARAITDGLLVQAWSPDLSWAYSMNGVTWSLSCEVVFYALFPLLLIAARRTRLRTLWLICGGAFVAASIFVVFASTTTYYGVWYSIANVNPIVRLPEFLLGIAAATTLQRGIRMPPITLLPVAVVCAAGLILLNQKPAADVWATPIFALVIIFAAQADSRRAADADAHNRRWLAHPALVLAGKVSFAFYLVHQLVINNVQWWLGNGLAQALLALAISAGIAASLHFWIEKPAHRLIVSAFAARKTTTASDSVSE